MAESPGDGWDRAGAEREIRELCKRLEERDRVIADQQKRIEQLQAIVEELRRGQKRQAAPFSKGPPKEDPKKPGRKPGDEYGAYSCRKPPTPREVDERHRAKLPRKSPCCGAGVKKRTKQARPRQYQDELV